MKKVFIVHGFEGSPNGAWRPWLMGELEKQDIYACALAMPTPEAPVCHEWVAEISRHVEASKNDHVYLVGHSLGVPAILRYLEKEWQGAVRGMVLISGPSEKNNNRKIDSFLETPFDFDALVAQCIPITVIHGDNDPNVPLSNAEYLAKMLDADLTVVKNGQHLNGSAGWFQLPEALEALNKMINTHE